MNATLIKLIGNAQHRVVFVAQACISPLPTANG